MDNKEPELKEEFCCLDLGRSDRVACMQLTSCVFLITACIGLVLTIATTDSAERPKYSNVEYFCDRPDSVRTCNVIANNALIYSIQITDNSQLPSWWLSSDLYVDDNNVISDTATIKQGDRTIRLIGLVLIIGSLSIIALVGTYSMICECCVRKVPYTFAV